MQCPRLTSKVMGSIIYVTNFLERLHKMKKSVRIIIPIILVVAIIACSAWYLLIYDRGFTRDVLLSAARYSESQGNHNVAEWFYNRAYAQAGDSDAVAIELSEQYKAAGNYTKAEYTLYNSIADGAGVDVYIALSKTYVEQDKLLDAVNMLDSITNEDIKAQLHAMRPLSPSASPEPGFYSQYISVTLTTDKGVTYTSTNGQYPTTASDPYEQPIQLSDGENTIYALTISDNGLVSPLSIFGYTVGGVVKKMEFADPAVEAAVRTQLNVGSETELYTNDLWTITEFTVPAEAVNYADIQHMQFLETLIIEDGADGQLLNIATLANLTEIKISGIALTQEELTTIAARPSLKKLTLSGCSLSSITPLENAKELIYLDLSNNTIRNINALQGMSNLTEVYLQQNTITDLSALSSAVAITKLNVANNALTSLSPISELSALTWLDAATNNITDLGDFKNLNNLNYLNLKSNNLTSVDVVSVCTALEDLNVSSNALTSITKLSTLINVLYLDFSHNQVTEIPKFPKDCALVTINGSHNLISSLEPLSGLEQLNNVHMDYNTEISSIKPLVTCHRLIEVNVYATKVTDVTPLTNQSVIVNYNPVP